MKNCPKTFIITFFFYCYFYIKTYFQSVRVRRGSSAVPGGGARARRRGAGISRRLHAPRLHRATHPPPRRTHGLPYSCGAVAYSTTQHQQLPPFFTGDEFKIKFFHFSFFLNERFHYTSWNILNLL